MKILTPVEKTRMIRAMEDALEVVRQLPEYKDCKSCKFWENGTCMMFQQTPPDHVQAKGCESWESDEIPF